MPDPNLTPYPLHCPCGRSYTRAEFLVLPQLHPPQWHEWGCFRQASCLCGEVTLVSREGPEPGPVVDVGADASVAEQLDLFGARP